MDFKELNMRNTPGGMIWQVYHSNSQFEINVLTATANKNGFIVSIEPEINNEESLPGWRKTEDWKKYSMQVMTGEVKFASVTQEMIDEYRNLLVESEYERELRLKNTQRVINYILISRSDEDEKYSAYFKELGDSATGYGETRIAAIQDLYNGVIGSIDAFPDEILPEPENGYSIITKTIDN